MTPTTTSGAPAAGPVLMSYDGSELAELAIVKAGEQLSPGRDAVVVCVWQPVDVGFTPIGGRHLDADQAADVQQAAEETAAHGAALAEKAGFRAHPLAVEASPTWKGIVDAAEEQSAGVVVIGSRRHPGLLGHILGSVASAVIAHTARPVLIIHPDE